MNLQERQQFWQQQVNTWQTTGLSGAAFCKQQGLNYSMSADVSYSVRGR